VIADTAFQQNIISLLSISTACKNFVNENSFVTAIAHMLIKLSK